MGVEPPVEGEVNGDMNLNIQVKTRTKLKDPAARDKFRQEIESGIRTLGQEGEELIAERLRIRPAGVYKTVAQAGRKNASKGFYASRVEREQRGLHMRIHDSRVVYGPWLERGRSGTRFKGYHVFANTATHLRKRAKPVFEKAVQRFINWLRV